METILIKSRAIGTKRAILLPELNPNTVKGVLNALPLKGVAKTWGQEIYFEVPLNLPEEKSRREVEKGEVAYWPPGRAICIFFGPTPMSTREKIIAYSPVNVFARMEGDLECFKKVKDGEEIIVEKG